MSTSNSWLSPVDAAPIALATPAFGGTITSTPRRRATSGSQAEPAAPMAMMGMLSRRSTSNGPERLDCPALVSSKWLARGSSESATSGRSSAIARRKTETLSVRTTSSCARLTKSPMSVRLSLAAMLQASADASAFSAVYPPVTCSKSVGVRPIRVISRRAMRASTGRSRGSRVPDRLASECASIGPEETAVKTRPSTSETTSSPSGRPDA